ncbi:glycoside hydrolase family 2 protein [Geranomyces variabilis]|nr:glycoside hydrolase family 2 protein [Geranomyces variabilis]KAJ3131966.1 hypothetical protein HDU90_007628 [Geranomyces variabilis]
MRGAILYILILSCFSILARLAEAAIGGSSLSKSPLLDLSMLKWTVQNICVPAKIPGQVHLDLYKAGVIPDPYFRINEFHQRWIAYEPYWTYTASLPDVNALSNYRKAYLVFEGFDTACNISHFGQHIGIANNQFRQWIFDVTPLVHKNKNPKGNLTIQFQSAVRYAGEVAARSEQFPPQAIANITEFENRQYIRKIQSDFGWDWGPAFAPVGIWQPAYFVGLGTDEHLEQPKATAQLKELNTMVDIYREGQVPGLVPDQGADWILNASVSLVSAATLKSATMTLDLPELGFTSPELPLETITTGHNYAQAHFKISKDLAKLWWPWDLGHPQLYNLTITITPNAPAVSTLLVHRRVGFRTILLNLLPYPKSQTIAAGGPFTSGDQFHFEINGMRIFAKGSNWVPADAFQSRITGDRLRNLLTSAVAANMNVFPGAKLCMNMLMTSLTYACFCRCYAFGAAGRYESDELYDIADELGLLLWSEAIFTVTAYPVDDAFVSNVVQELEYNARRINHHPSLACWVGNNENEWFTEAIVPNTRHYLNEYNYLYVDVFQHVLLSITRSITYVHSSTTQGWLSGPNPWVARYQNRTAGELYGSTEGWSYGAQLDNAAFNISLYSVSRFVNEFGFHSMPSVYSWDEVLKFPDDYSFNSSVIVSRNHKPPPTPPPAFPNPNSLEGMGEMTRGVVSKFPTPSNPDRLENFTIWCHATQLFQAQFMQSQIEYYRFGAGQPNNNLGSLVWQLNDIWQAPTWASIEYNLRWKVVHYHLKRVYQPVIISPIYASQSDILRVYATSDLQDFVRGNATMEWFTWTGRRVLSKQKTFETAKLNSTLLWQLSSSDLSAPGYKRADTWLRLRLKAGSGGQYQNENYFASTNLRQANLTDVKLTVMRDAHPDRITITSHGGVGAYVWVDHPACITGHFNDNSVFVTPGEPRTFTFTTYLYDLD